MIIWYITLRFLYSLWDSLPVQLKLEIVWAYHLPAQTAWGEAVWEGRADFTSVNKTLDLKLDDPG